MKNEAIKDLIGHLLSLVLPPAELKLLKLLARRGVCSFAGIQKYSGLTSGYVATILKRLQKKGFLKKEGGCYIFIYFELFWYFRGLKET